MRFYFQKGERGHGWYLVAKFIQYRVSHTEARGWHNDKCFPVYPILLTLCLVTVSGAETRGGIYPPNNLAVSPAIVWEWSTCASPPIIWMGVQLSVNLGKKVFCSRWRLFFFAPHLKSGRKSVLFLKKTFFFGDHLFLDWKTVWIFDSGRNFWVEAMKIRVKVACSCLTLSNPGYAPGLH